jgi:MtrB/PioB family decaheme-associated outer membrane protein
VNFTQTGAGLAPAIIAAALLAVYTCARADEADDYARLTQPASNLSVGISTAASGGSDDRALFGQYNGLRDHDTNLLLDFDVTKLDRQTGTWTIITGRDLGLDTPELNFTYWKQGDWKAALSYEEIVFHDPYTINTGMRGFGSTNPTVVPISAPGAGGDQYPELKRKRLGVDVDKWLTPSLQAQVNFKSEHKEGTVEWGRGFACGTIFGTPGTWNQGNACNNAAANNSQWATLMLGQPVDSTTNQVDAKLNFSHGNLFLSGGYYGSFYTDDVSNLTPTVPGGNYYLFNRTTPTPIDSGLANVLSTPMALWPDNQAHQFYVDGTYAFTEKVRSTFNLSYTHAIQDQNFGAMGLTGAPPGGSNLEGDVDTWHAQAGVSAQPTSKLSLTGDVRFEDRDDKTPVRYYNQEPNSTGPLVGGPGTVETWTNTPLSNRMLTSKFEAAYQLPWNFRGSLGFGYQTIDRYLPAATSNPGGLTALREETNETTYQAQLRRAFSDKVAGSASFVHSSRTGGDWYLTPTGPQVSDGQLGAANPNGGALPSYLLDRIRNAMRWTAEFTPNERTSVQFVLQQGRDSYTAPMYTGMKSADSRLYSADVSYAITSNWKLTGFATQSVDGITVGQPSTSSYLMNLREINDTLGLTVTGKPWERLEVGATAAYTHDNYQYNEQLGPAASTGNQNFLAASGGLPGVTFMQERLNLYARYTLDKNSAVRVDYLRDIEMDNEWTWGNAGVPYNYADNTTVSMNPSQGTTLVMARYIYTFR